MGTQREPANRPHVRDQQRHDLGNAHPVVAHHRIHRLGQQQRRVKRGLHQRHRRRSVTNRHLHASNHHAHEQHRSGDLPLEATVSGPGEITSWFINASLPTGLTFETSNGTIWGTPTQLLPTTPYTIWANNSGGSNVAYLNITVIDQVPIVSYSPENITLTNNTGSSDLPLNPSISGPGEITSWDINGSLPTGVFFGTNNGTLWGIPSQLWPTTEYTVWANNSGGSTTASFNLTVVDQVPTLSYSPSDLTLYNNTASSDSVSYTHLTLPTICSV